MAYRLMVFDFDGTLADSLVTAVGIFNRLAAEYGYRPIEDVAAARALTTRRFLKQHGIGFWRLPRLVRRYQAEAAEEAGRIAMFPSLAKAFAELRARSVRLGVLSSNRDRVPNPRWTRVAALTALLPLAAFGAAYAATSASFDGAKWDVAQETAKHLGNPSDVDGGFEWNNYHVGTVRYMGIAHPRTACIVLVAGAKPPPGATAAVRARHVWNPAGADLSIVAWRNGRC